MSKQAFLIDIDGVLYVGDSPVPGAADAISDLKKKGIQYPLSLKHDKKIKKNDCRPPHRHGV